MYWHPATFMLTKLQTARAKQLRKLRSSTVEPVIGTLVNYLAMKRVNTRGLEQVNKCMLMAAVAYNLKKLLKFTTRKVSTIVKSMEIKAKKAIFNPFLLLYALSVVIAAKAFDPEKS